MSNFKSFFLICALFFAPLLSADMGGISGQTVYISRDYLGVSKDSHYDLQAVYENGVYRLQLTDSHSGRKILLKSPNYGPVLETAFYPDADLVIVMRRPVEYGINFITEAYSLSSGELLHQFDDRTTARTVNTAFFPVLFLGTDLSGHTLEGSGENGLTIPEYFKRIIRTRECINGIFYYGYSVLGDFIYLRSKPGGKFEFVTIDLKGDKNFVFGEFQAERQVDLNPVYPLLAETSAYPYKEKPEIIRIWNFRTGEMRTIIFAKKHLHKVIFSPDGKSILGLSGSASATEVNEWDLDGKHLRTIKSKADKAGYIDDMYVNDNHDIVIKLGSGGR